jgi:hypothetical protein
VPAGAETAPFAATVGNQYLRGVRRTAAGARLAVCFDDPAGAGVDAAAVAAYLAVSSAAAPDGLVHQIAASLPAFDLALKVATSGCALLVSFRNEQQYPFAETLTNGLYAHEGDVSDPSGTPSPIPVVYLNTDALELDPAVGAAGGKPQYAGLVLEHELAHYLGLKHSATDDSVLSPAGYHATWPESDRPMFDEYAWRWQSAKP